MNTSLQKKMKRVCLPNLVRLLSASGAWLNSKTGRCYNNVYLNLFETPVGL